jgi:hypothetical protein
VLHGLLFYAPDLHQRYARVSLGLDQNNRSVPLATAEEPLCDGRRDVRGRRRLWPGQGKYVVCRLRVS